MKYLLLILLASCSRPTYMTVTNVAEIDGKRPKRLSAKGKVTIKQDLDLTKKFYHD